MPKYHLDKISRLDDIEALITTTQELIRRLNLPEMSASNQCMSDSLQEVRKARDKLISKCCLEDSSADRGRPLN